MDGQIKKELNVPASKLPVHEKKSPQEDFRASFHWRVFRIMAEFVDGFQFLADFNDIGTVTFFGSSRTAENSKWYQTARELGQLLAENGFGVVTGGGPGILEAANRGAFEGKGESIGLNIKLPHQEERSNPYVKKSIGFHYFFARKLMLTYSAQAFVFFPGGFTTLDEFSGLVTLIQTKKISTKIPIICVGKEFWGPLDKWIKDDVYGKFKAIDEEDRNIYTVVDTPQEALEIIKRAPHIKYF